MQPQCESTADVGQSRLLAGISRSDVQVILARATERRLPANAVLIHEGAAAAEFFLIARGRARYFATTPDGDKMILRWLPPAERVSTPPHDRQASRTPRPARTETAGGLDRVIREGSARAVAAACV